MSSSELEYWSKRIIDTINDDNEKKIEEITRNMDRFNNLFK